MRQSAALILAWALRARGVAHCDESEECTRTCGRLCMRDWDSERADAIRPLVRGDDALTLPFMSVGAQGVISVASNLLPKQLTKMVHSYLKGDHKGALKLHEKYYPLFKDLFIETNPVPVKSALSMKGLVKEEYRLPLVKLNPDNRRQLRATLMATGVIK